MKLKIKRGNVLTKCFVHLGGIFFYIFQYLYNKQNHIRDANTGKIVIPKGMEKWDNSTMATILPNYSVQ